METQNEGSRRKAKKKREREKFYDVRMTFRDQIYIENINYGIKLSNVVENILMNHEENRGSFIGKLFVSELIIAEGSNGAILYDGLYDLEMPVAVKRIVRQDNVKSKENQSLRAIEVHQNIIPLIHYERDAGFEYLAFERCLCDLFTLFRAPANTQDVDALRIFGIEPSPLPNLVGRLRLVFYSPCFHLIDAKPTFIICNQSFCGDKNIFNRTIKVHNKTAHFILNTDFKQPIKTNID